MTQEQAFNILLQEPYYLLEAEAFSALEHARTYSTRRLYDDDYDIGICYDEENGFSIHDLTPALDTQWVRGYSEGYAKAGKEIRAILQDKTSMKAAHTALWRWLKQD